MSTIERLVCEILFWFSRVCMSVGESGRVWNMWRCSQRNSGALMRTSPGWQLVKSSRRIGGSPCPFMHAQRNANEPCCWVGTGNQPTCHTHTRKYTLTWRPFHRNFPLTSTIHKGTSLVAACLWVCVCERVRNCALLPTCLSGHINSHVWSM